MYISIVARAVQGGSLKHYWFTPRGFESHTMHLVLVAQLVRASVLWAEGRGFETLQEHVLFIFQLLSLFNYFLYSTIQSSILLNEKWVTYGEMSYIYINELYTLTFLFTFTFFIEERKKFKSLYTINYLTYTYLTHIHLLFYLLFYLPLLFYWREKEIEISLYN